MCLSYEATARYQTTKKDVVCYKILKCIDDNWYTPFRATPIDNDVVWGRVEQFPFNTDYRPILHERFQSLWGDDGRRTCIGDGFVHACASQIGAENVLKELKSLEYSYLRGHFVEPKISLALFKCVIPKGTLYVTGRDDYGNTGYACKKIKFVEKIKEIEIKK